MTSYCATASASSSDISVSSVFVCIYYVESRSYGKTTLNSNRPCNGEQPKFQQAIFAIFGHFQQIYLHFLRRVNECPSPYRILLVFVIFRLLSRMYNKREK